MNGRHRAKTSAQLARLAAELVRAGVPARQHPVVVAVATPDPPDDERPRPIPGGIRIARIVLIGLGIAGLTFAGYLVVVNIVPRGLGSLGLWLVGALVLHDGVLSPLVLVTSQLLRRVGRKIPGVVLAIVQGAVVVGVFVTFVVVPEIVAKHIEVRNPTVEPFDYALRLAVAWAFIAAATAITIVVVLTVRRRSTARGTTAPASVPT